MELNDWRQKPTVNEKLFKHLKYGRINSYFFVLFDKSQLFLVGCEKWRTQNYTRDAQENLVQLVGKQ